MSLVLVARWRVGAGFAAAGVAGSLATAIVILARRRIGGYTGDVLGRVRGDRPRPPAWSWRRPSGERWRGAGAGGRGRAGRRAAGLAAGPIAAQRQGLAVRAGRAAAAGARSGGRTSRRSPPRRAAGLWHPVALDGRTMSRAEQRWYSDGRRRGTGMPSPESLRRWRPRPPAPPWPAGRVAGRAASTNFSRTLPVALATYLTVAGKALGAAADDVARPSATMTSGPPGRPLPALVGRDPAGLERGEIARAVVESVGENTVDAIVAPAFWAAIAGGPGGRRLPGRQHPRRHGRPPLPSLRPVRVGQCPGGRRGGLGTCSPDRSAGRRGTTPAGPAGVDGRENPGAGASVAQRRRGGGGLRGRARAPARGHQSVRPAGRGPPNSRHGSAGRAGGHPAGPRPQSRRHRGPRPAVSGRAVGRGAGAGGSGDCRVPGW